MAGTKRSIAYLEGKFQTGDIPTQQDFYDLFATFSMLRETVALSGSNLTLDLLGAEQGRFVLPSTALDFTLIISNASTMEVLTLDFECSAEIDITMPTSPDTLMPTDETGWAAGVLTVPAGIHSLVITFNGTIYRATLVKSFIV